MLIKKKQFIKDLKKDSLVNDIFVVRFKKPVEAYKKGYKFELRLADSSKEIMCKYWGPSEEQKVKLLYDLVKPDSVVFVQGRVAEWNKQLEISCNEQSVIRPLSDDEYDVRDFVRIGSRPADAMFRELLAYVDSVKDSELRRLLDHFFRDEAFVKRFKESPAAMFKHHGWIGGLLEHTLSVVSICLDVQKLHSNLDKDLLVTGALLHDMGKIDEFQVGTSIKVSDQGRLLGHITIAVEMLTRAMDTLNTPENLRMKVLHMMITHMGEYGSNKLPGFPEALAVYYADKLDADLLQMSELKETAQTEDDYIYSKDFGSIYLK
jgi:3'-5' exoribonuclease